MKPRTPPPPAPTTPVELLARLRTDPCNVATAAEMLSRAFDDRKSWNGFHAVARRAFEGEPDPSALVDAWNRANGPKVRNRGALFIAIIGRSDADGMK